MSTSYVRTRSALDQGETVASETVVSETVAGWHTLESRGRGLRPDSLLPALPVLRGLPAMNRSCEPRHR